MLIETAVVTEYRNGIAKVRCETKKGCSGCAAQASCGAAVLSELNGSSNQGELLFELKVDQPLKIGQMIEIGLQRKIDDFIGIIIIYRATDRTFDLDFDRLTLSTK